MKIRTTMALTALLATTAANAYQFDPNVPADVQKQMTEDLTFVTTIEGSKTSPLHHQIFGAVDGASYQKFFDTRVTRIGLDSCGSPNAVACVKPWVAASMFITQNYIKFSHPQISRLMVVFHEARHTERQNGNWAHATCPRPFNDANGQPMRSIWTGAALAGEPACDSTPLGSYGSSTLMLKNIANNCSNCTEKVKMDAALYAQDQLGRITNPKAKADMIADSFGGGKP